MYTYKNSRKFLWVGPSTFNEALFLSLNGPKLKKIVSIILLTTRGLQKQTIP